MKRGITTTILFALILLILPMTTAVEVTLTKTSYQPQELLQAEITGNFESLTSNNVFIYKDDKAHPEPVIKGLTKQGNKYYFYAILPNYKGNFSFRVEKTSYLERGISKTDPISKNFEIIYKNTSDLSINPGFLIPNKDFKIKIKSLYKNQDITATFEATGESKTLSLIESIEKSIKFDLPELDPQQSKVTIGSYEIPVFLIKETDQPVPQIDFEFTPIEITGTIIPENDYEFLITLKNTGVQSLTNIQLSSDLDTQFIPEIIELLEPQQSRDINLKISLPKITEDQEQLSGSIFANITNNSIMLPVLFNITNNESQVQIDEPTTPSDPTTPRTPSTSNSCSDIGELCKDDEICNGEEIESLEGPCCIGECERQKSGGLSSWIGFILVAVVVILVGFILWKVKKRKGKHESPDEVLEERSKKYKDRLKAKPINEEVKDKLDNV